MKDRLEKLVHDVVRHLFTVQVIVDISRPDPQFGDAATNVAMQLARELKKPPREIAEAIAAEIEKDADIAKVEVAGPGFINVRFTDVALARFLYHSELASLERAGETVVIETNNPNPFKDLHIGHAYNCIIADTIANLLEASGAETHRVSYHGDVGLHVGRSMWAILKFVDGDAAKLDAIELKDRAAFMSKMYVEGAKADKEDEKAHAAIEALVQQSFQPDDPLFKHVYETCKLWSFNYLDTIIERLGSRLAEKRYLESEADTLGVKTVKNNIDDIFTESKGAIIFKGEDYGLHTRVFIASRGTGLYEARDLGLMQLKQRDYNPDKSYIITAEEQKDYFNVVIKAAELAMPALKGITENISTGTVKLSTGKMSSRTGEVLNIEWLFAQLEAAIKARGAEPNEAIITAALRYAFLKVRIGSDVIFDINESVSVEGNSGPYLQYAHARACSILAKSKKAPKASGTMQFDNYERALVLKLQEYREVTVRAMDELLPHYICTYLYELAQTFNRFYEHSRVIDDPREQLRLALIAHYAETLRHGLGLLAIPAPEYL
ncbi:MAG TPA: arginine--tRNA ligase [Candidatus Saccharimonadales bacterium]